MVASPLKWGAVATIKAPLDQIAGWAAYHLDLGASSLHIYLDDPVEGQAAWLARDPRVHVTECTPDWWQTQRKPRMPELPRRQMFCAAQTYSNCAVDWLAHIDVDEFVLTDTPVKTALAQVPDTALLARMMPVEQLAALAPSDTLYFKKTPAMAGHPKALLESLYPTFGAHLRGGFLGHTEGKAFFRTGVPRARPGVHTLRRDGAPVPAETQHRLTTLILGHCHAPDWAHFRDRLAHRRAHGSYGTSRDTRFTFDRLIDTLVETDGESALRILFDEVATARPDLLAALAAHDMLITTNLDLAAKTKSVFGALP